MTRAIAAVWAATLITLTLAPLSGCGTVDPTTSSPPKPGQEDAVAMALAAYGLPASTPVPIAWVDAECLNGLSGAPDVQECIAGWRDSNNGQVVIAWHPGATHVRDVRHTLAHEIAHIKDHGDDLHGCSSEQDPDWKQHHRCGDFWGVGGVVDAVALGMWAL